MNVVTRFAPSPTGYLHAGNYRTALFSYIFARQNKGKFILRIEDTDVARSKKEYEENILESLKWLGLEHDEFCRQSDRTGIYKKYIQLLIDSGHAYVSKEKSTNAGDTKPSAQKTSTIQPLNPATLRAEVIRFKNPNKKVAFNDLIRGTVEFDTTELNDFVIAKSMEEPVFHLVNVIDDHDNSITHIIRGEDHISNTPRQILIYEALGFTPPIYAHIPLLLSKDRSKLSKRKGAVPITDYRNRGYIAEAVVNYLALLGWHPSDDREVLTMDELLKVFSLERVQKSGAIFDEEKLNWFNKQYMAKLDDAEFARNSAAFAPEWLTSSGDEFKKLIPVLRDKITTFSDIATLLGPKGELSFIQHISEFPKAMLLWKKNPDASAARKHLEAVRGLVDGLRKTSFDAESIKAAIMPYAEQNGKGDVLWPMRVALTGLERSPDPLTVAFILGKDESLVRLDKAIEMLK